MLQVCWRTYRRRALPVCLAYGVTFAAAVGFGYTVGRVEHVPPASAVTPAPSGTGKLGRAPTTVESRAPKPSRTTPAWRNVPDIEPRPRRTKRPPSTPSPSTTPPATVSPTPETSPTGEPASPKAPTPTP